jgi:hypothetical protein
MVINYTKWLKIIPNDSELHTQNGRELYQNIPFQGVPKFTKIRIFGLQVYHLATLGAGHLTTFFLLRLKRFFVVGMENIFVFFDPFVD